MLSSNCSPNIRKDCTPNDRPDILPRELFAPVRANFLLHASCAGLSGACVFPFVCSLLTKRFSCPFQSPRKSKQAPDASAKPKTSKTTATASAKAAPATAVKKPAAT